MFKITLVLLYFETYDFLHEKIREQKNLNSWSLGKHFERIS